MMGKLSRGSEPLNDNFGKRLGKKKVNFWQKNWQKSTRCINSSIYKGFLIDFGVWLRKLLRRPY